VAISALADDFADGSRDLKSLQSHGNSRPLNWPPGAPKRGRQAPGARTAPTVQTGSEISLT
jgi:hypothetical protein